MLEIYINMQWLYDYVIGTIKPDFWVQTNIFHKELLTVCAYKQCREEAETEALAFRGWKRD